MRQQFVSSDALSEPLIVEDIFVDRLGGIDDAGDGMVRFTFCSRQRSSYDGMSMETVVRVRLVAGPSLILFTIRQALRFLGMRCCGAVKGWVH